MKGERGMKDPFLVSVMIWAGAVFAVVVWWMGG